MSAGKSSPGIQAVPPTARQADVTEQTIVTTPTKVNEVNFSTLADLITSDIKREKSLATTITYSGIAILLALLMLIDHSRIWAVGIIPIVIGIGYYVVYRTVD